jgi:hypothetical protein
VGITVERFVRSGLTEDEARELSQVDRIADQLAGYLRERESDIRSAHVHGARSSAIQAIVAGLLTDRLSFGQEVVLTREDGFVSRIRPDFVYWLSNGRGIIAEVERGGTVNNNHDLKDFWKVHVAPDAQHLFLIVPNSNWSSNGLPREKPFRRVAHRLGAFFGDPRKEVDVVSLHLFGYGDELST